MFGIGLFEMLIIALAILIFFGPHKLPEIMRQIGRFYVQIQRMTNEVKFGIDEAIKNAEYEAMEAERKKIQKLLAEHAQSTLPPAAEPISEASLDSSKSTPGQIL